MKILDRYILKTFLKTFISVFVILMLIFVLQAIWLYIKELAGKDLDIATVLKFLFYITPTLIPLILPLTILLSSIMVFGSFAENYEFAAMKSTGISLQRAMMSLSIFIGFLALTTFFFSNNVIPAKLVDSKVVIIPDPLVNAGAVIADSIEKYAPDAWTRTSAEKVYNFVQEEFRKKCFTYLSLEQSGLESKEILSLMQNDRQEIIGKSFLK